MFAQCGKRTGRSGYELTIDPSTRKRGMTFSLLATFMAGAKYFTIIDLSRGYYPIQVREEDKHKTAFRSPNGLWEFNVMPCRLKADRHFLPSYEHGPRPLDTQLSRLVYERRLRHLGYLRRPSEPTRGRVPDATPERSPPQGRQMLPCCERRRLLRIQDQRNRVAANPHQHRSNRFAPGPTIARRRQGISRGN